MRFRCGYCLQQVRALHPGVILWHVLRLVRNKQNYVARNARIGIQCQSRFCKAVCVVSMVSRAAMWGTRT
jgi:hypothetical protein